MQWKAEVGRTAPPVKSVAPVAAAAHPPRVFPNALHFTADIVTTLVLAKKYDSNSFSGGVYMFVVHPMLYKHY